MSEVDFSIDRSFAVNPSFPEFRVFQHNRLLPAVRRSLLEGPQWAVLVEVDMP